MSDEIDWDAEEAKSNAVVDGRYLGYVAFAADSVCLDGHFSTEDLRIILAERERLDALRAGEKQGGKE